LEKHEFVPSIDDKKTLLRLARQSIQRFLNVETQDDSATFEGWMSSHNGAFVSLHKKSGELRGCLGRFVSDVPLFKLVQELSVSAASRDYRFSPVKKSELAKIVIEISVLSSLSRVYSLSEIERGKHGIYIKKGNQTGTYLPQVILETNWDIETFVSKCSNDKAGLGYNGWRDAELFVYTAEVFSE
jgi:MEMO1 family protein